MINDPAHELVTLLHRHSTNRSFVYTTRRVKSILQQQLCASCLAFRVNDSSNVYGVPMGFEKRVPPSMKPEWNFNIHYLLSWPTYLPVISSLYGAPIQAFYARFSHWKTISIRGRLEWTWNLEYETSSARRRICGYNTQPFILW